MTNIQPTGNYILLRAENPPSELLNQDQVHPDAKLIVVAVGPKVEQIKPGDHVLVRPNFNGLTPKGHPMTTIVDAGAVLAIVGETSALN